MNIAGGAFITAQALLIQRLFPMPLKLDGMIIGAIMPLVPGMAFTNAIRDIADSDFLSGTVRMIDALLVFGLYRHRRRLYPWRVFQYDGRGSACDRRDSTEFCDQFYLHVSGDGGVLRPLQRAEAVLRKLRVCRGHGGGVTYCLVSARSSAAVGLVCGLSCWWSFCPGS